MEAVFRKAELLDLRSWLYELRLDVGHGEVGSQRGVVEWRGLRQEAYRRRWQVSRPRSPRIWHLVKKAVAVRKHLEVNRKDKDSKFRLILIESRIHRLARYYKTRQQIPPTFKYDSATASTLIA